MTTIEIILLGSLGICICGLCLCIGATIGMVVNEKINKTYYQDMLNIVDEYLEKNNEIHTNYYETILETNRNYLDKTLDLIIRKQKLLANYIEEINKDCYIPIWKNVDEELPECEGIYYGKKDETNAMWKVIYRNNEWFLSGYPDTKIEVIKWTELY